VDYFLNDIDLENNLAEVNQAIDLFVCPSVLDAVGLVTGTASSCNNVCCNTPGE